MLRPSWQSSDNDPMIGNSIDATSSYELEYEEFKRKGVNLSPDIWLARAALAGIEPLPHWCVLKQCCVQVKLLCGAVDRALDEQVSCCQAAETMQFTTSTVPAY